MPFTTENSSAVGSKGGKNSAAIRWKDKTPNSVRNRQLKICITQAEFDMIDEKAVELGLSRVDLVVKAVQDY